MFAQIPAPPPGMIENVLLGLAALASSAALIRNFLTSRNDDGNFATRAEVRMLNDRVETLNHKFDALTDRFDARLETLGQRMEQLAANLQRSINQLDTGLARVDERTRK